VVATFATFTSSHMSICTMQSRCYGLLASSEVVHHCIAYWTSHVGSNPTYLRRAKLFSQRFWALWKKPTALQRRLLSARRGLKWSMLIGGRRKHLAISPTSGQSRPEVPTLSHSIPGTGSRVPESDAMERFMFCRHSRLPSSEPAPGRDSTFGP
jgi:hypothetical protein